MKASHDTNADNSAAKQAALDAMTAREWPQALAQWKAHWADHPDAAGTNPDDMHDRAVSHFHSGEKDLALDWLNKAGIQIDRKMLADMAANEPEAFAALAETAKKNASKPHTVKG